LTTRIISYKKGGITDIKPCFSYISLFFYSSRDYLKNLVLIINVLHENFSKISQNVVPKIF
jgi:hypothetical protein